MSEKLLIDCETGEVAVEPHDAGDERAVEEIAAATEELAWQLLRSERTGRLAQCDWTQGADAPLTPDEVTTWADYRQALRDLPEATTDPHNPAWPEPPPAG